MAMLGLFSKPMRELREMRYQWRQPFVLDDTKFRTAFGVAATPWDVAIGRTMAWARERYSTPTEQLAPAA